MTLRTRTPKRWQIVSDDHVWFYPPDVSLSTVELPFPSISDQKFESCLFFVNGESDVVRTYDTKEEAIRGHIELEDEYKLKRIDKSEFKI
jgi:hypothetical protein